MDIKKTVCDYYSAMNPVICFVSEETFQVQTKVEQAADELNKGRGDTDKVRLLLHDPLVGIHFGEFKIKSERPCGAKGTLNDLERFITPGEEELSLGEGWEPIHPQDDCIMILKGWERFLMAKEPWSAEFVQALSNILQGNMCATCWAETEEDVTQLNLPPRMVNVQNNEIITRGRRMLVFISKHDDFHPSLTEIRPIYVPLPGREQFVSLVERQWTSVKSRKEANDRPFAEGIEDHERFRERLIGSLAGFPLSAGEDALMLSIVENKGFTESGNLATIERLKAASIARVPGLTYVPQADIDTDSVVLPGYEPVHDFIRETTEMDAEFARQHNIDPLSGIFVVGPPGTGKSVVSVQVSRILGKPQLVWSMGESQGSLVSESERNTRRVIDTANILSATLTLDDSDKMGLGTDRTSNDGGVFDRMINILLTEMSRPGCKITWVINGNRVQKIRPELYRDGRVDERFFVDLPDDKLRAEILRYHIRKYDYPVDEFNGLSSSASKEALLDLASDGTATRPRTKGWSGAELAGLVLRSARVAAKARAPLLDIEFMLKVAGTKTPQSQQKAAKADYADMRNMCSDFIRVGVSNAGKSLQASGPSRPRRQSDIPT